MENLVFAHLLRGGRYEKVKEYRQGESLVVLLGRVRGKMACEREMNLSLPSAYWYVAKRRLILLNRVVKSELGTYHGELVHSRYLDYIVFHIEVVGWIKRRPRKRFVRGGTGHQTGNVLQFRGR